MAKAPKLPVKVPKTPKMPLKPPSKGKAGVIKGKC